MFAVYSAETKPAFISTLALHNKKQETKIHRRQNVKKEMESTGIRERLLIVALRLLPFAKSLFMFEVVFSPEQDRSSNAKQTF